MIGQIEDLRIEMTRSHYDQLLVVAANTGWVEGDHSSFLYTERFGGSWSTSFDGGGPETIPSELVAIYCDGERFYALVEIFGELNGEYYNIRQWLSRRSFLLQVYLDDLKVVYQAAWDIYDEKPNSAGCWISEDESSMPEEARRILEKGIREVRRKYGQGSDFFDMREKNLDELNKENQDLRKELNNYAQVIKNITKSKQQGQGSRDIGEEDRILCPFCGALQDAETIEELEFSQGCQTCGEAGTVFGSIEVRCSSCGRKIYEKYIDKSFMN